MRETDIAVGHRRREKLLKVVVQLQWQAACLVYLPAISMHTGAMIDLWKTSLGNRRKNKPVAAEHKSVEWDPLYLLHWLVGVTGISCESE